MAVWFSSGIGLSRFVRPVLGVSAPVLVVVGLLALLVWPWENERGVELKDRFERRSDLSRIAPGQFQRRATASASSLSSATRTTGRPDAMSSSSRPRRVPSRSPPRAADGSRSKMTAAISSSTEANATRKTSRRARRLCLDTTRPASMPSSAARSTHSPCPGTTIGLGGQFRTAGDGADPATGRCTARTWRRSTLPPASRRTGTHDERRRRGRHRRRLAGVRERRFTTVNVLQRLARGARPARGLRHEPRQRDGVEPGRPQRRRAGALPSPARPCSRVARSPVRCRQPNPAVIRNRLVAFDADAWATPGRPVPGTRTPATSTRSTWAPCSPSTSSADVAVDGSFHR